MSFNKVLVVDDSLSIHALYDCLLPEMELSHATDGIEGLAALRDHPDIDLILLDLNMPHMDGMSFLAGLQADPRFRRLPVVVVTGDHPSEDSLRVITKYTVACLTKPFRAAHLVEAIYRGLGRTLPVELASPGPAPIPIAQAATRRLLAR